MRRASLLLLALLTACKMEVPAPAAAKLVAPTEEEARRYAEQFIEAVSKPNVARASMMIDWDLLLDRATAYSDALPRFRSAFIRGAKQSAQLSAYVQQLAKIVEEGGTISLLRLRGDERDRRALLRVLLPDGGVTYTELLLTRDQQGFVRAADIYAYATGELASEGVRRLYLTALAAEPSMLERLAGKENTSLTSVKLYKEVSEKVLGGQHQEAVELIKKLPPELRREKNILVAWVSAAANLEPVEYETALDALRRAFPDDAGIDLMLIDGYFLKKRYDEAFAAVDRLERSLGGDPYLDALRANMLIEKGDLAAAQNAALRAASREPSLVEAQWALVSVSLSRKDFDETSRLLTRIENDFQVLLGDLKETPEYAGFVKSSAYRRWMGTR